MQSQMDVIIEALVKAGLWPDQIKPILPLIKVYARDAAAAEREACALAAEATGTWVHDKPYEVQVDMRARIAAAIRSRQDTDE